MLATYIAPNKYEHIAETNKSKRADWIIELFGHPFIIEQKSPLVRLSAKQQDTDIKAIKDYFSQTLIKALRQLSRTERELSIEPCYKLVLLYEDYIYEAALSAVFHMPDCDVKDDDRYRLITIGDMEKLLYLAKNHPEQGDKIIKGIFNKGKSIHEVLVGSGVHENEYLKQEKFVKYENIPMDLLQHHLPN